MVSVNAISNIIKNGATYYNLPVKLMPFIMFGAVNVFLFGHQYTGEAIFLLLPVAI